MRHFLVIQFLSAIMLVNGTVAQNLNDPTTKLLDETLNQWHRDAANAHLDEYIGSMADEGVFIGTDAMEYWTTAEFKAFCQPYFDKGTTWNFIPLKRNISLSMDKNTAWFDELLNTHMGICRGSGILQRQGDQWKIEQYVLSATIPNEQMREVTREKLAADSALILKMVFDRYGMKGSFLLLDSRNDRYLGYNPPLWDSGYLPASTFKIPNSLIGLETQVIDTATIFRWDRNPRALSDWNRDLTLREAFQVSCVPCYQEVARKIGVDRMREYLKKLSFGTMDVHPENIDSFWLEGNSRISPRQQVTFLQHLNEETLPLTKNVMEAVKSIMLNEETSEYRLLGKTGWAIRNGNNYGWFVGWIVTGDRTYYLATLIEPEDPEKFPDFHVARKAVTMDILRNLGIIGFAGIR
ncbi:MAG: class D beta-lactamase [Bacteroidales bacterium]|nr:class D beta-lactamase [Bacteroidales bacterium]